MHNSNTITLVKYKIVLYVEDNMNLDILHRLIDRYEDRMDQLYNADNDELFKWRATKTWQREWNKPENAFASFESRFKAATKDFNVFIDGKIMHPSTGIIMLWKKEQKRMEQIFNDILLADTRGDIDLTQRNMDAFLDEYEKIRSHHFSRQYYYKLDRHSASVFLAVNNPETQYVFRSSDAHMMATYTDFGFNIGAGGSFSLRNYYTLCDEIVKALREHDNLLQKHFSYFNDSLYRDESLHLLAFDLMYCCNTYKLYGGLPLPPRRKPGNKKMSDTELEAQRTAAIEEKTNKCSLLDAKIEELEAKCEDLLIPLLNVELVSEQHGVGTVVEQEENRIVVQYPDGKVQMILGPVPKTRHRPVFDDDELVWTTFSEYSKNKSSIKNLYGKRQSLQKEIDDLTDGKSS